MTASAPDTFEELEVGDTLVEALAAEGLDAPTALQAAAIPVIRRGNNVLLAAGPGSGVAAAWGVALLARVAPPEATPGSPRIVVVTHSAERADQLAESLGRLASATGHAAASLDGAWALPERQSLLTGTLNSLVSACRAGSVDLSAVEALVVDEAAVLEATQGLSGLETLLEYLPKDAQRVVSSLPVTEGVRSFVDRHVRRAVQIPSEVGTPSDAPRRGTLRFRIVPEPREDGAREVVREAFAGDARHVLVFCRNDDRAADVADDLTLHGFLAGAPGDASAPVWVAVDALEAREAVRGVEGLMVVSCDVPPDVDTLDRRHGIADGGTVVILHRELAHLREMARRAGYALEPSPPPARTLPDSIRELHEALAQAIDTEDVAAYLVALEPLFARHDPAEVAAAAVALLRRKNPPAPAAPGPGTSPGDAAPAWSKLFLGVGQRDGVTPRDLLGAITGEAGVDGEAVGRIEIRDNYTLVEVHREVAPAVIRALNGTTIRGRAVRADYDRPRRSGGPARRPRR